MPNDERLRKITDDTGREIYINVLDIRNFSNFEGQLIIEMIDGTSHRVSGAPNVNAFYASTFALSPVDTNIVNNPLNAQITNVPLVTKEQLTSLTITSSLVSVSAASTLVLAANPNRKLLLIQRGTTVGRVFVKMSTGAATTTNGILFRENAYFSFRYPEIYTGEINAIAVGSNKILYVTEGS